MFDDVARAYVVTRDHIYVGFDEPYRPLLHYFEQSPNPLLLMSVNEGCDMGLGEGPTLSKERLG
jgi:hypothetical protein